MAANKVTVSCLLFILLEPLTFCYGLTSTNWILESSKTFDNFIELNYDLDHISCMERCLKVSLETETGME